jgi:hypothetical protein
VVAFAIAAIRLSGAMKITKSQTIAATAIQLVRLKPPSTKTICGVAIHYPASIGTSFSYLSNQASF